MTEYTDEKLAKMLVQVQALWAKAEATEFPDEAETFRAGAERLMKRFRIDEEMLRQTKIASGTAAMPVEVLFPFLINPGASRYSNHYYTMIYNVMNHVGVRGLIVYGEHDPETGQPIYAMNLIGFDSDVRLVEMLYMNLRETFAEKLEPKVDPKLSDVDNVYRLRSAGVERIRIARLMWGDGSHSNNAKVTRLYAEACAARGEDPKVAGRSVNAKTFRESYADAFVSETRARLRRMKATAAEEGGVLVLAGREDAVNEAFYERYPELRPAASLPGTSEYKPCEKCRKAKSGACRDHPRGSAGRPRAFSSVGWTAGTHAAREADLSRAGSDRPTGKLEG